MALKWYNVRVGVGVIVGLLIYLSVFLIFSKDYIVGNLIYFSISIIILGFFYYSFAKFKISSFRGLRIAFYVFSAISAFFAVYGIITGNLIILPAKGSRFSSGILSRSGPLGSLFFYNNILLALIISAILFYLAFKKTD